jgi:hypothetical protein
MPLCVCARHCIYVSGRRPQKHAVQLNITDKAIVTINVRHAINQCWPC